LWNGGLYIRCSPPSGSHCVWWAASSRACRAPPVSRRRIVRRCPTRPPPTPRPRTPPCRPSRTKCRRRCWAQAPAPPPRHGAGSESNTNGGVSETLCAADAPVVAPHTSSWGCAPPLNHDPWRRRMCAGTLNLLRGVRVALGTDYSCWRIGPAWRKRRRELLSHPRLNESRFVQFAPNQSLHPDKSRWPQPRTSVYELSASTPRTPVAEAQLLLECLSSNHAPCAPAERSSSMPSLVGSSLPLLSPGALRARVQGEVGSGRARARVTWRGDGSLLRWGGAYMSLSAGALAFVFSNGRIAVLRAALTAAAASSPPPARLAGTATISGTPNSRRAGPSTSPCAPCVSLQHRCTQS
jgi:hypothetical protein